MLCKKCRTPWANSIRKARQNWSQWKPQWPTVAEAAYWQPPKKPKTPKAPLPNKVLQALGVAWDNVPEEVQKNLQEAGYKPPKAQVKEEVDDLTDLLPEEVKAYLKGLKASPKQGPHRANVRPQPRAGTHAANCPAVPSCMCEVLTSIYMGKD